MSKIAVIYWSQTGNTEAMADLVAEGATVNGDQVDVFSVDDVEVSKINEYDKIALGCPAMGDESLEESEFLPFYEEIKPIILSKPVVLFGSYAWAEGAWMQTWQEEARESGLQLVTDGLICYDEPSGDVAEACKLLGNDLANA